VVTGENNVIELKEKEIDEKIAELIAKTAILEIRVGKLAEKLQEGAKDIDSLEKKFELLRAGVDKAMKFMESFGKSEEQRTRVLKKVIKRGSLPIKKEYRRNKDG